MFVCGCGGVYDFWRAVLGPSPLHHHECADGASYRFTLEFAYTSNSLPIALMQSLTYTVEGLKWGKHDSREAMLGRALSYLVLFSTLGIILRWSFGISLLSNADEADEADANQEIREIDGRANGGQGQAVIAQDHAHSQSRDGDGLLEAEEGHDIDTPLIANDNNEHINGRGRVPRRPSPRTPRFSEGPVTLGRPPSLTRTDERRRLPSRRWTALGNNGDIDDTEVFHKPIYVPNPRSFRKEISNFRSFPNTPSRTPAASSYTTSSNNSSYSSHSDTEGNETETGGDLTSSPYQDDDGEDSVGLLGEVDAGNRASGGGSFTFGMGRRKRTEPSRNRWQAAFRRNRRQCWVGYKRWVWRPFVKFMRGVEAFMTAPL